MTFILFVSLGNLIFTGFHQVLLFFFYGSINVYLKLLFILGPSNNFSCDQSYPCTCSFVVGHLANENCQLVSFFLSSTKFEIFYQMAISGKRQGAILS